MIKRLLIANRGEIACRIIASAKEMGITTIAIFSKPDSNALHVQQADEAYALGGERASESYLNKETILSIAKENSIDAIHPGYGFLAEDSDFAKLCNAAKIIFVGPSPECIHTMGDKEQAKAHAQQAGVPIANDYRGDTTNFKDVAAAANDIGYPILVKATAGGGGKGMRLVEQKQDLEDAMHAAEREAESSFGNAKVFLEKYIKPARHIEVQIAFDQQGNGIHLYTRECSIQRRHQKIIEEAPAPIPEDISKRMCECALNLGKSIQYTGLGTIEFLLDNKNNFYFMEMNTRLQVEHPVTEMITGIDCVALQLNIAAGLPIPIEQREITKSGYSIEARICAENPLQDFIPCTGKLKVFTKPKLNNDVRIDTGVLQGDTISPFYDPMIAKLIVHGADRNQAINKLEKALQQTHIGGISTNLELLHTITTTPDYIAGSVDTSFIDIHMQRMHNELNMIPDDVLSLATLVYLTSRRRVPRPNQSNDYHSPWESGDRWRSFGQESFEVTLNLNKELYTVELIHTDDGYLLHLDDKIHCISGHWDSDTSYTATIDDHHTSAHIVTMDDTLLLFATGRQYQLALDLQHKDINTANEKEQVLRSPMPGTVTQLLIAKGDTVNEGQTLICVEAMKMEHAIKAPGAATVKEIHHDLGSTIDEGADLIELEYI